MRRFVVPLLAGFLVALVATARADFGPAQGVAPVGALTAEADTLATVLARGADVGDIPIVFGTTDTATVASDVTTVNWAGNLVTRGLLIEDGSSNEIMHLGHDGTVYPTILLPENGAFGWTDGEIHGYPNVVAAIYANEASSGTLFIDAGMFQVSEGSAGLASTTTRLRIDDGVADFFGTQIAGTTSMLVRFGDANATTGAALEWTANKSIGVRTGDDSAYGSFYADAFRDADGGFVWGGTATGGVITAAGQIAWGSSGLSTPDVGIERAAAGILGLTDGSTGDGKAIQFAEVTAPTGLANAARLYAVDNGAGKTQLVVIFGSGAAQVLATEPP